MADSNVVIKDMDEQEIDNQKRRLRSPDEDRSEGDEGDGEGQP